MLLILNYTCQVQFTKMYDSYIDLEEDYATARETETDIHLAYAAYLGNGDDPK